MQNIQYEEAKKLRKLFLALGKTCTHNHGEIKEYMLGSHIGDYLCSNCYETVRYK